MFLNIKKFPLHQRAMFPLPVGNYREIAGKSAPKRHCNINIIYNINMLNNDKIFAPFQRDLARLLGAPVLLFLDGPGPPGGFSLAPPYPPSFPSSCLGTQIYRAAPAAPPLIFSLFTGGPPSHEDLPSSFFPQVTLSARFTTSRGPKPNRKSAGAGPKTRRASSAKLPRNYREMSAKIAITI